jgi:hypothetical protein
MTRRSALLTLLALALLAPLLPALAQQQPPTPPPVWTLAGFEDEGRFTFYSKGKLLATTEFSWSKSGRFFNAIEVQLGDRAALGTTTINVDGNGLWTRIEQQTTKGPVEITREGKDIQIRSGEIVKDLVLRPGTLVMEDMSPALMSQAVLAYDHEKGGKQEFGLFFVPAAAIRGSLEFLESLERTIGEEQRTFRKYRYLMLPIYPVDVIVDGRGRVCLASYPMQEGVFVREGFDALRDEVKFPEK